VRDIASLIDHARRQGWAVEQRASNHLMFRPPSQAGPLVISSGSPSDHRALANVRSQLWRAGLHLDAPTVKQTNKKETTMAHKDTNRATLDRRLSTLERTLGLPGPRAAVDQAVQTATVGLPEPARQRVAAQFSEASVGRASSDSFADEGVLRAAVAAAAAAERAYIDTVASEASTARASDIVAARERRLDDLMDVRRPVGAAPTPCRL